MWPNIRRLGRNRVDAPSYPTIVEVPLLVAVRLSAEEANKGPQVLELLIEIYDVLKDQGIQRIDVAEPVRDLSAVTPGPVGYPLLLTPSITLELPRPNAYQVRVGGRDGRHDFLLAALAGN